MPHTILHRPNGLFMGVLTAALLALLLPAVANAGSDNDDTYFNSPAYYAERGVPYAGKDLGYDYLTDEYYRYAGQPVQDRRAREQEGYRDGVLHTRPRGYYRYDNNGCGCGRDAYYRVSNGWGEHEYRGGRHYVSGYYEPR